METQKENESKKLANDIDSDLKEPRVDTILTQGVLAERIKEWRDRLIAEKLNPWESFGIVNFKIVKYDGTLIRGGKGIRYEGSPQQAFWNFIEPFLRKGIDEWLELIADLCLKSSKDPKPYLQTAKSSLNVCIYAVYSRMASIDQNLRKAEVACLASENFGKNIRRKDVNEETTLIINYLDRRYKEVLTAAEREYQHMQTEQKANISKPERESWWWKLYERTLKAFFDSLLGKFG